MPYDSNSVRKERDGKAGALTVNVIEHCIFARHECLMYVNPFNSLNHSMR